MIKAVILDVDGTIISSTKMLHEKHCMLADKMGLRHPTEQEFGQLGGMTGEGVFRGLWPEADPEELRQAYLELPTMPYPIIPGVLDAVKKLKEKYVLGIVTGKMTDSAEYHLKRVGFDLSWFEFIHGEDITEEGKPSGKAFSKAMTILGLKNITEEECVYCGDSINDEVAAEAAGIRFIGVLSGHTNQWNCKSINSVAELPNLMDNQSV